MTTSDDRAALGESQADAAHGGPSAATASVALLNEALGAAPTRGAPSASPYRRATHARGGHIYAALDLGTNNCRLLIAHPTHQGFRVIDAFSRIVRLGEGLAATQRLSETAIVRTIAALKVCQSKMHARGVTRARTIATEACRSATNGEDFIARVAAETGLQLEVVDRQTEAFLAVGGCASLAHPSAGAVVLFDIGGGSTEIAWLDGPEIAATRDPCSRIRTWASLPVGVVSLAERHGGVEVSRATYEVMVDEVRELLRPFVADVAGTQAGGFHLLGTSGTVTTIAGVHLDLKRYERQRVDGLWMSDEDVSAVLEGLLKTNYAERAANPCIGRERADLVLAGCAILEGIRREFPSPRLRIADRGLREGILLSLMREDGVLHRGQGA